MPSADQVPVKNPHSTMRWHKWVVLIAGSTGSALRAVRPPNLHITPSVRRDLVTPQARRVPCSAHPWPSWPRPFVRSCWRVRSRRPSWAAAPTMRWAKAGAWCHGSWHSGSPPVIRRPIWRSATSPARGGRGRTHAPQD